MRKIDIFICAALVALVWSVFGQTLWHDFVNYDDRVYVTQNLEVSAGLTTSGILGAFTHGQANNWHPLTTISHMLDCQLFGLRPGAHHAVNVVLHTCAVLLLFWFFRLTTTGIWPSAFVAAVFAIHPLRVESVAWIAERKDVLSAVFFMLTLIAYVRYVRTGSLGRYLIMSILCACALMSKPTMVTLPLLLLLIDYWPLRRSTSSRLFLEKIPLVLLAIVVSVFTFVLQRQAPGSVAPLPLWWRIENAIVSYVVYIAQMFWPNDLIVFYPHPEGQLPLWQVAGAATILLGVSAAAFRLRLTKPYFFVGWLWYVILLAPVIGIVGFGLQGHADRYTYLAQIGLYFAITWWLVDLATNRRGLREIAAVTAAAIVLSLGICAWKQARVWQNSETLWRHALAVSPQNDVAHTNFGRIRLERDDVDGAISEFEAALTVNPHAANPHHALELAIVHSSLGEAFARKGEEAEAASEFRKAITLQPKYADAHYNLGVLFSAAADYDSAIDEWRTALEIRPDDAEARTSMANALLQKGALRDAIAQYTAAVKAPVPSIVAANNLAWILATAPDDSIRNGRLSYELARRAVDAAHGKSAMFLRTLSAALAELGKFEEARATVEQALEIARANNDIDLTPALENDVDLYQSQRPLRDRSLTNER
jgi:protein O-mannosyl-transferase